MNISWNFPGNQDGQIKGIADAGIENFNGTELSSLARENCQNSLDAALDDNNPKVLVEFERYFVHDNQIPGIERYLAKKKTVMALCIALHLDLEQSKDLLARADWAFSPSSKVDLIVQKAIIDKQYDIMQLNVTLFKYTNEILGV